MFRTTIFAILSLGLLLFSSSVVHAQKVGSPAWKLKLKQRQAEIERQAEQRRWESEQRRSKAAEKKRQEQLAEKREAKRQQRKRQAQRRAAAKRRKEVEYEKAMQSTPFDSSMTPAEVLEELALAVYPSTPSEKLMPFVTAAKQKKYMQSKSKGSDQLEHLRDTLTGMFRIDKTIIKGHTAFVRVVIRTDEKEPYQEGIFKMTGEGTRWMIDEFTGGYSYHFVPETTLMKLPFDD